MPAAHRGLVGRADEATAHASARVGSLSAIHSTSPSESPLFRTLKAVLLIGSAAESHCSPLSLLRARCQPGSYDRIATKPNLTPVRCMQVVSASHGGEGQIFGDGLLAGAAGVVAVPALGPAWYHCVATRLHVNKLHVAAWNDEYGGDADPDTSFVFPNPADSDDMNVSLVPAVTRVVARTAGADHQRTLGTVTVVKSPTMPSASHVYSINNAGICIVES